MPRCSRLLLAPLILGVSLLLAVTSASAIESGRDATVRAEGDCLRLRAEASINGQILTCLVEGTTVSVLPGALTADGFAWRLVSVNGQVGWVVEQYLEQSDAPPPGSPPPPPPAANTQTVTGVVPSSGGGALIVWGGGPLTGLISRAGSLGCNVASLWVTNSGGTFISYIAGAPDFANAAWTAHFPGDLPAGSPYVTMCNAGIATAQPAAPAAPAGSPSLSGDLPAAGGFGLVVWGGGSASSLVASARTRGCDASSVWANNVAGQFIAYIDGAPDIVNVAWSQRFPGGLMPGDTAVVVVCRGKEAPPSTGSGPLGPPGIPPGMPALPPGPAGNH
jgi:hypothetical protein